jgi:hypothetical protein
VNLIAKVPEDIDRDRVRFWHCPGLPDLPPKLAPVDAVVVEDGQGRLNAGLDRLLDQLPSVLNPRGVAVVALPAEDGGGAGGGRVGAVKKQVAALGFELVHEEARELATGGGAVLLVCRAPSVSGGARRGSSAGAEAPAAV